MSSFYIEILCVVGGENEQVCDVTCGTGRYGDYNCNWRDRGVTCRYCFVDLETALIADEVAQRRGGRVIMCNTHETPPSELLMDAAPLSNESTSRELGVEAVVVDDNVVKEKQDIMSGEDIHESHTPQWEKRQKWKKDETGDVKEPKWKRDKQWQRQHRHLQE